jgi:hypothetical protein
MASQALSKCTQTYIFTVIYARLRLSLFLNHPGVVGLFFGTQDPSVLVVLVQWLLWCCVSSVRSCGVAVSFHNIQFRWQYLKYIRVFRHTVFVYLKNAVVYNSQSDLCTQLGDIHLSKSYEKIVLPSELCSLRGSYRGVAHAHCDFIMPSSDCFCEYNL